MFEVENDFPLEESKPRSEEEPRKSQRDERGKKTREERKIRFAVSDKTEEGGEEQGENVTEDKEIISHGG